MFDSDWGAWVWAIITLLLLAGEVLAPGAFMLWLAFAAAAMFVVTWLFPGLPFLAQAVLFTVLGFTSILIYRRYFRNREPQSDQPALNRRTQQLIGRVVPLERAIERGTGRVQIADAYWTVAGPDLPDFLRWAPRLGVIIVRCRTGAGVMVRLGVTVEDHRQACATSLLPSATIFADTMKDLREAAALFELEPAPPFDILELLPQGLRHAGPQEGPIVAAVLHQDPQRALGQTTGTLEVEVGQHQQLDRQVARQHAGQLGQAAHAEAVLAAAQQGFDLVPNSYFITERRQEELKKAQDTLEWSTQLYEKGFVERTELERDELAFKRNGILLEQARRAQSLLVAYEQPKEAARLQGEKAGFWLKGHR